MNGIFGVISDKFRIFDIASFFAIPPNSASYGLLEEFLFIFQIYEISITLTISSLEKYQHFTKNKIENMESVTGIDLDAMREAYRIIAL